MQRIKTLTVFLTLFSLTVLHAKERPNVLFILSEDQGSQLGFLGTAGLQTPNLDSIARSGVYFDNAFVAYPVCSASKAAFYTALHNHTNGILNNTHNFHKPADQVTPGEKSNPLAQTNRIKDPFITLTEVLSANGYFQGVTHKLHVLPNEKFPYDRFMHGRPEEIRTFLDAAKKNERPFFLMVNIPNSHRPYPNSEKKKIRVDPNQVSLPKFLPDSPVVRRDWAEYLAGIEEVDSIVGDTMRLLQASGEAENTIVIYMSDHGPTFQHGKMTLYNLGLRVPLAISGPGIPSGIRTKALASELDLMPTLIELVNRRSENELKIPGTTDNQFPYRLDGISLADVIEGKEGAKGHQNIFAEISNEGVLPNKGIQERSVFDGRWKLIYRENVEKGWRQVNADSRMYPTWGNRTYDETIRLREQFPMQYRVLAEMDPQNLGGNVERLELYDLKNDPDELNNLVNDKEVSKHRERLYAALRQWAHESKDPAIHPPAIELIMPQPPH